MLLILISHELIGDKKVLKWNYSAKPNKKVERFNELPKPLKKNPTSSVNDTLKNLVLVHRNFENIIIKTIFFFKVKNSVLFRWFMRSSIKLTVFIFLKIKGKYF